MINLYHLTVTIWNTREKLSFWSIVLNVDKSYPPWLHKKVHIYFMSATRLGRYSNRVCKNPSVHQSCPLVRVLLIAGVRQQWTFLSPVLATPPLPPANHPKPPPDDVWNTNDTSHKSNLWESELMVLCSKNTQCVLTTHTLIVLLVVLPVETGWRSPVAIEACMEHRQGEEH